MSRYEVLRSFDNDLSLRQQLPSGLGAISGMTTAPSGSADYTLNKTEVAALTRADEAGPIL